MNNVFAGEQKIAIVSQWFDIREFREVYKDFKNKKLYIEQGGKCIETTVCREPLRKHIMYEITLGCGKSFICTDDHLHDTDNGEKKTTELNTDDYLCIVIWGNDHWDRIKSIQAVEVKDKHIFTLGAKNFILPNGIKVRA